jgi:hypothetical protein
VGRRNAYIGRRPDYTVGDVDVSGKVVLFCHDAPDLDDATAKDFPLARRIAAAAAAECAAPDAPRCAFQTPPIYAAVQDPYSND